MALRSKGTGNPLQRKPKAVPAAESPTKQLAAFLDKYTPELTAQAKRVLARMRALVPGATELVYDNYNALAIGFGPTDRSGDCVFSIAVYPRWVSLFFLSNALELDDPEKLLKGSGKIVRHIVLEDEKTLDRKPIQRLMQQALAAADPPIDPAAARRLVIKSVSANQRSRRP